MANPVGLTLKRPTTNGGECGFRLALITLHNICAILENENDSGIPEWLLNFLDENGKKGFIDCKNICDSFGINKLSEFWSTIFTIGIPSNFIHVNTDQLLTAQSPNAHIQIRVTSDINYIHTTVTGQKLLTDISLLNIQHAGKYMLYNNKYKKYLDTLTSNGIAKYYARYALNNILYEYLDTEMKNKYEKKNNNNISLNNPIKPNIYHINYQPILHRKNPLLPVTKAFGLALMDCMSGGVCYDYINHCLWCYDPSFMIIDQIKCLPKPIYNNNNIEQKQSQDEHISSSLIP
eukprot:401282_1